MSTQIAELISPETKVATEFNSTEQRFIKGQGKFVEDIYLPGMLYATIVRSAYARAKIIKLMTDEATRYPGVSAILTGKDAAAMTKPFSKVFGNDLPAALSKIVRYCLSTEMVNYVGEPVVAIAAENKGVCKDAAELVNIEYDPLEPVIDASAALGKESPRVYNELESNAFFSVKVKGGDADDAFRRADIVHSEIVKCQRYTGTPIQPRGYVASYSGDQLTIWGSLQSPHIAKSIISDTLGMPESNVRIIAPDVGGSFGVYQSLYPELVIVSLLSKITGRPVKWIEERSEHFKSTCHARECTHFLQVAARKDGFILGIRDKIVYDIGYIYHPASGLASAQTTCLYVPGPYKITNYDAEVTAVATNKTAFGAYRGFGKENATLAIERAIDHLARKLGIDPVELRMRNFIQPDEFPYISVTGELYDSGNYPKCMEKLLELSDYEKLKVERDLLRKHGRHVGIGFAFLLEPGASKGATESVRSAYESATVRIEPTGSVTVLTGLTAQGQDHEGTFGEIVANELGVSRSKVTVFEGDTQLCPYGMGTWSSRSVVIGVPAIIEAARLVKEKLLAIAAHNLRVEPEALEISDSQIISKSDRSKSISLKEVARIAYFGIEKLPIKMEPGLSETKHYFAPSIYFTTDDFGRKGRFSTVSSGACLAMIEVDPESGKLKILKFVMIHDCGTVLNEHVVESQIQGGVVQGIGGTIDEELIYDSNGQLLTTSFMDYLIPVSVEVPNIEVGHIVTKSPFTLGGFKGTGEGGTIGAAPAIANAVEDALSDFAAVVVDMPLKPEQISKLTKKH